MPESIKDFAEANKITDDALTKLLPRLADLYNLKLELNKALKETECAIKDISTTLDVLGIEL